MLLPDAFIAETYQLENAKLKAEVETLQAEVERLTQLNYHVADLYERSQMNYTLSFKKWVNAQREADSLKHTLQLLVR